MYEDKIEINSPGGLPSGISKDENMIYELIKEEVELSSKEIDLKTGFIVELH